jgi:two-component system, LytTR family, response regulator
MNATKQYQCMVVDDEDHAIELLSEYIQSVPALQLVKTYQDPVTALMESSSGEKYDFIFLDIDMPRLSGIELARSLRAHTTFLVFTTAHARYALDAFDVKADQFLLKPIAFPKFLSTVDGLLKSRESHYPAAAQPPGDDGFFIKSDQKNKLVKLQMGDIIAVEGLKNYVILHTPAQRHVAYLTMKEVEMALRPQNEFIRVHKSFIIAKKYIERIEGANIVLSNNLEVPIGDTYRQGFFQYVTGKVLISSRS